MKRLLAITIGGVCLLSARFVFAQCAPIVVGQPIPNTYMLHGTTGEKRCTTNSASNRFGICTTDTDCGGTAGACMTLPWVTADGQIMPFSTGTQTTFTVNAADSSPTCEHALCIPCGNPNAACAGIPGCEVAGNPNGCVPRGTQGCCSQPAFIVPTFFVNILGGLCSRVDQIGCGGGVVNTSNPQTGHNKVAKAGDTSDPGPDCCYNGHPASECLSQGASGGPFGGDDPGCAPDTKDHLKCSDGAYKAFIKAYQAVIKCHTKQADAAQKGAPADDEACETNGAGKSAKEKLDAALAKLTTLCSGTTVLANVAGLETTLFAPKTTTGSADQQMGDIWCTGSTNIDGSGDDAGTVDTTSKDSEKCADGVAKNLSKLLGAVCKCHVKQADSAFGNKTFDEESCEDHDALKGKAALDKYSAADAKLVCPQSCLDAAHRAALGTSYVAFLESINDKFYPCSAPVNLNDDPTLAAQGGCTTSGAGNDYKGKITKTVGGGAADANGIQFRYTVPELSTTWTDGQSPPGTCANGSTYDDGELLVSQLILKADTTTSGASGSFTDQNGDGCKRAGAGFISSTNPSTDGPITVPGAEGGGPARPQPYDGSSGSVAAAVSEVFSGPNSPIRDIGFVAITPQQAAVIAPNLPCTCTVQPTCPE